MSDTPKTYRLSVAGLEALFDALERDGRTVVGPRAEAGAIVYAELQSVRDLPVGIADEQAPGRYRLRELPEPLRFGYAAPVRSLKPWFHPERERLFAIRRGKDGMLLCPDPVPAQKLAIFGARACDLVGLGRLDQTLLGEAHPDVRYRVRRADTLLIAVHCTMPADSCFCASMGTGPRAASFDLALTEGVRDGEHLFLLEVGSEAGHELVAGLDFPEASQAEVAWGHSLVEQAARAQKKTVDPEQARDVLRRNLEHPHWDELAERCMACANCTASCPTCFCSTIEDTSSLDGAEAERHRQSDSCYNSDFSHMHGGPVRGSVASRYRQWLTHKFSHWYDQFGSSGCVGCGRCITWCPVGIDVTEELTQFGPTSAPKE